MADPLEIKLRYVVIDDIDFTPWENMAFPATLRRTQDVDDFLDKTMEKIPLLKTYDYHLFKVLKIMKPVPIETLDNVNASETTRRNGGGESLSLAPILRHIRNRTAETKRLELADEYVKFVRGHAILQDEFKHENSQLISAIVMVKVTATEEADRIKEDLEPGMIFRRKNLRGIINGGLPPQTSEEHGTNLRAYALMDRPENRYTFPVALFDQNLALLQYRLENLGVTFGSDKAMQLFPDELTFRAAADQFITVAIGKYYRSKDARMEASRGFLEAIFGDDLELDYPLARNKTLGGQGNMSTTTLDGAYVTMIKASGFPKITRVILGVKSSAYEGDALSQMTKGFAEEVYGFKDKNYFDSTYFPKILVALNGHKLEISIAVCLETVVVNEILSLDIRDNLFRSELQQKLSRVAVALKACSTQLDVYYSKLEARETPLSYFPSPTLEPLDFSKPLVLQGALEASPTFPGVNIVGRLARNNTKLVEKSQPAPSDMRHNVFLAKQRNADDSSTEVVVKIVKRYGQEAHHCLAQAMLAPRLLLCQPIIGNLIVVVMQRDKGKPLKGFLTSDLDASTKHIILERLNQALALLKDKNLVHGDLRDMNIMLDKSNPQAVTVNIIDFDWAAKDDEGFYPNYINVSELHDEWHDAVKPSKKMRIEHDECAIAKLCKAKGF